MPSWLTGKRSAGVGEFHTFPADIGAAQIYSLNSRAVRKDSADWLRIEPHGGFKAAEHRRSGANGRRIR